MSALTETIQAGVAVATCLGSAIAFLWQRVERMSREVRADLDACEDARNTQLIVIEIFWRELDRISPRSSALKRGGKLLEELKRRDEVRQAKAQES